MSNIMSRVIAFVLVKKINNLFRTYDPALDNYFFISG